MPVPPERIRAVNAAPSAPRAAAGGLLDARPAPGRAGTTPWRGPWSWRGSSTDRCWSPRPSPATSPGPRTATTPSCWPAWRRTSAGWRGRPVTYHPLVGSRPGEVERFLRALAPLAAAVVTDDVPGDPARAVDALGGLLDVRLEAVDAATVFPFRLSGREFPTAYLFRRQLQRHLAPWLARRPAADPLAGVRLPPAPALPRAAGPPLARHAFPRPGRAGPPARRRSPSTTPSRRSARAGPPRPRPGWPPSWPARSTPISPTVTSPTWRAPAACRRGCTTATSPPRRWWRRCSTGRAGRRGAWPGRPAGRGPGGGGSLPRPRPSSTSSSPGASWASAGRRSAPTSASCRRCRRGPRPRSAATPPIRAGRATPGAGWSRPGPTTRSGTRPSASSSRPGPSTTGCACCGARRSSSGAGTPRRRWPPSSPSTTAGRSTGATPTRPAACSGASAATTARGGRSGPIFGTVRYMSSENAARKHRLRGYLSRFGPRQAGRSR